MHSKYDKFNSAGCSNLIKIIPYHWFVAGSGGGAGTATAQLHLRQAAAWLDIHFLNKPTIQIHRFTEKDIFDDDGNLISEKWRGRVQQQMLALQQWTELFQK